jgi:ABC-type transport system involved in multi-copper enzyme maturation permease subunit
MLILRRELKVAARCGQFHAARAWFSGILLVIVVGTFVAWHYAQQGAWSADTMSAVAGQSFLFVVIAHAMSIFTLATTGAVSIAREMDRKTLGFLLATRLTNAEIVLGKLAACVAAFAGSLAAGLPVMILLNVLGGVHPRLILLAYAGIASTAFFILTLALWVSSAARDGRRATSITVLAVLVWLIVPLLLGMTPLLSRIGIRPPAFLVTINAWILASNPVSLLPRFIGGINPTALSSAVSRMCALQLAAAAAFVVASIARLRAAYRTNAGGDGRGLMRRLATPAWRFRPRPPVGDDPIFWRERYTTRTTLIGQITGFCFATAILGTLAYFTCFFGGRAFVELWHHGYSAASASAHKPELNLVLRFFLEQSGPGVPIDAARTDFNIFLRLVTCVILFMMALVSTAIAGEVVAGERTRETWNSLIATPLSGRDILLGKLRASLWRLRTITITVLSLWTLGLLSGALQPLGFIAAVLVLTSSTGLYLVIGLWIALTATDRNTASSRSLTVIFLPMISAALPFLLPARYSSVLWGAGSTPFLASLSLVTHRELHHVLEHPLDVYPAIVWLGLHTGEGPIAAAFTCLIGIIAPALAAWWIWNHCLAKFDLWVGRPCSHRLYHATSFSSSPRSARVRIRNRTCGKPSIGLPPN